MPPPADQQDARNANAGPSFIGFPPPLLGETPMRLPVLACGEGWLALDKPPQVALEPHPWRNHCPALLPALRKQLALGKPELAHWAFDEPASIYDMDAELSGVALIATSRTHAAALRNALGSQALTLRHLLLCQPSGMETRQTCTLPLCPHSQAPRMVVSHRQGKRAETHFQRLQTWAAAELWEASLTFSRPHQVRLHAAECGLRVFGESLYGEGHVLTLREVASRRTRNNPVLTQGLALHLHAVSLPGTGEVQAPLPRWWQALLKRLATP